ncbi:HDL168Cp [Eremothecium sinecaudum]|uniref:glutaminase n=1 Tax=Eremothecium sinecaudum TaxID=45286 RepID=A0A0X8HRC9_9SACH|nr:HDL168Cp [Eremothecium sinecaudum]AMD20576.1 HDL168Cp [Eremothecium sinecaudum]
MKKVIGVLALQGAYLEHIVCLKNSILKHGFDVEVVEVRTPEELQRCDSLVIPGGESTAISQIAERTGMYQHLYDFVHSKDKSVWGTCAGLIFLANEVKNQAELLKPLRVLDVVVERNAFGRQAQSFVTDCDFSSFWDLGEAFSTVFIRAPVISKINSEKVQLLHKLETKSGQSLVVAVRQDNILGTSFHPELGSDLRFHEWYIREFVLKDH